MLQIQNFLKTNGLESLASLGIDYKLHNDGRVILNYDQIKADKKNECVRECRGLVLNANDNFSLVARGFRRFFNLGEIAKEDTEFNWGDKVLCTDKEDGSFILLYKFNGKPYINTRFSFAEHNVNDGINLTWTDLFLLAFDYTKVELEDNVTYVLELCSRYNKVVRDYSHPSVYLLTAFRGYDEVSWETCKDIASQFGLNLPRHHYSSDVNAIQDFITQTANNDPTFEGLVLRDNHNNRLKVKSAKYVALHNLNANGNLATMKHLVPIVLKGEIEEVSTYFPEIRDKLLDIEAKINAIKKEIDDIWFCFNDLPSQKKFALKVLEHTKFSAPLFSARQTGKHPWDFLTAEYLLKHLFKE